jgi:uncharacterized protein (DUF1015 family)
MAVVRPFRAVRYAGDQAGPWEHLVAPPYDVLDAEERRAYLDRSPHNVVHLTLPESPDDAARLWREWQESGVLVREEEESAWLLEQEYVGPDGVGRTRRAILASLRAEPYESKAVLPHERTHRGPKEDRLRLLRAVRAQLEPILLLYDAPPPVTQGAGEPDVTVDGMRLWRIGPADLERHFGDVQLLIADGHHRYETALAFADEEGSPVSSSMLVGLVSMTDPGLMIFPTHRVFERRPPGDAWESGRELPVEDAMEELGSLPYDRAAVVQVTRDGARLLDEEGALDVELVDRLGHEGISYTPDWEEAVRRVREGEAEVAYLLGPTPPDRVLSLARRGAVLPQKSTYFYPKLPSGLLFHPLD